MKFSGPPNFERPFFCSITKLIMCLILFGWKSHPQYDLVLVANRDEFYDRPTQPAHEWNEHPGMIAGKDLTAGGTWMGITKTGRFAALTNYRDPKNIDPNAPSRGHLTKDFLISDTSPLNYLSTLKSEKSNYNGFNLLVGDQESLWYYNNVNHQIKELNAGVYGLSNALLDDPWPKVVNGKHGLKQLIIQSEPKDDELIGLVMNNSTAPDEDLPDTGVPLEWEKALSAMFIAKDNYGTRCSSLVYKKGDHIKFKEITHPLVGQKKDQVEFIL